MADLRQLQDWKTQADAALNAVIQVRADRERRVGLKRLHAVPTMLSPTLVLAADRWVRCFAGSRLAL